jgi:hypothetical protein
MAAPVSGSNKWSDVTSLAGGGADTVVYLATLSDDGPSGRLLYERRENRVVEEARS